MRYQNIIGIRGERRGEEHHDGRGRSEVMVEMKVKLIGGELR
ncbi:MAG: hypothetical protein N2V77_02065 [Canidatus Methanoxibalbensis ujae]|nr:hypothetical protein [Candidatus Methanoxibalbensis ujae]